MINKIRTILSNALYTLLAVVLLISCSDSFTDPKNRVWYGDNGMIIVKKAENDKHYGKYKYYCKDDFNQILIRTDKNWNVGDTLFISR